MTATEGQKRSERGKSKEEGDTWAPWRKSVKGMHSRVPASKRIGKEIHVERAPFRQIDRGCFPRSIPQRARGSPLSFTLGFAILTRHGVGVTLSEQP